MKRLIITMGFGLLALSISKMAFADDEHTQNAKPVAIEQEIAADTELLAELNGLKNLLVYEDFNFDGIKDFAIMDSQPACQQTSSYKIFLGSAKNQKFEYSPDLSKLSQEYCGFLNLDKSEHVIKVVMKKGCCNHLLETYRVVDNKPVLWIRDDISLDGDAYEYLERTEFDHLGNQISQKSSARFVAPEDETFKPLFAFDWGKRVKQTLYVYELPSGQVDLASVKRGSNEIVYSLRLSKNHPSKKTTLPAVLTYDKNKQALCVKHDGVEYTVYDAPNQRGIKTVVDGKQQFFLADKDQHSQQGALENILTSKMSNVLAGTCP